MRALPFVLRRPCLLLRDLLVDRDRPAFGKLEACRDPEAFVWGILPHAARTFSACITMLPYRVAKASAVAYLYCRMLDTYEDLLEDPGRRDASLAAFAARFEDPLHGAPGPAPRVPPELAQDARDAAHVLLVERCDLVDRVFADLPQEVAEITLDLVREMAAGMRWSSRTFAAQGGALRDGAQLARYCYGVLGTTIVFSTRLFRWHRGASTAVDEADRALAADVGEFLQLANVTRDIEKDLLRGRAYDPSLARHLGRDARGDRELEEDVRVLRSRLLDRALERAPAFRRLVASLPFRRLSLHRASAVLMLLFTERYYRRCAVRCGRLSGHRRRSGPATYLRAFLAFWSHRAAERALERGERNLLALARAADAAAVGA